MDLEVDCTSPSHPGTIGLTLYSSPVLIYRGLMGGQATGLLDVTLKNGSDTSHPPSLPPLHSTAFSQGSLVVIDPLVRAHGTPMNWNVTSSQEQEGPCTRTRRKQSREIRARQWLTPHINSSSWKKRDYGGMEEGRERLIKKRKWYSIITLLCWLTKQCNRKL